MKVMIVDDEPLVLTGLAGIIKNNEELCADVLCVPDGFEALERLPVFVPDCIITDICMPQMNGLEMLEKVVKTGLCDRFIILTCHAEFEFAQEAIKYRVIDYLLKPINKDKLIELLKKISHNLHESKSLAVKTMLEYINNNFMRDISLDDVACTVKLHPNYASSLFNKEMGMHFVQYLNNCRVMKAKAFLIKNPDMPLTNISKMAGFQSLEHFYKVFKKISGVTPGDYRLSCLT